MKDRLLYWLVRALVGVFGLLPVSAARRVGNFGGSIWHRIDHRRRAMVKRHMTRVMGPEHRDEMVREVFRSYGRYWAETFWVKPSRIGRLDKGLTIDGLEHLKSAAAAGRGAVITLPHLGNWEVASLAGPRAGIRIVAVAEQLPNRLITAWFTSLRQAFGIEIHLNDKGVMRNVEESVRRGGAVCLLADRDLKGRGVPTEFFGEQTTLPAGPVALAARTGAPLLSAACYFTPTGHHLVISPPIEIPEGSDRLSAGTKAYAARLERAIKVAPEQWHLLQPNWPTDRDDLSAPVPAR